MVGTYFKVPTGSIFTTPAVENGMQCHITHFFPLPNTGNAKNQHSIFCFCPIVPSTRWPIMPQEFATLAIRDETFQLPNIVGTRGVKAIDIGSLLKQTDYITLDNGYMNTGASTSSITYLVSAKGVLDYRDYA